MVIHEAGLGWVVHQKEPTSYSQGAKGLSCLDKYPYSLLEEMIDQF